MASCLYVYIRSRSGTARMNMIVKVCEVINDWKMKVERERLEKGSC